MKVAFCLLVVGLLMNSGVSEALEWEPRDGYRNEVRGETSTKQNCELAYLMDMSSRSAPAEMTWRFPEATQLSMQMAFSLKVFKDIFVTGWAFSPYYDLPREYAQSFSLSMNERGERVIKYFQMEGGDGSMFVNEAQLFLTQDLEPLRIEARYRAYVPESGRSVTRTGKCTFQEH